MLQVIIVLALARKVLPPQVVFLAHLRPPLAVELKEAASIGDTFTRNTHSLWDRSHVRKRVGKA